MPLAFGYYELAARAVALCKHQPGAYVRFLVADDPDHVREPAAKSASGGLQALTGEWDADDVFHRNQNIPPP